MIKRTLSIVIPIYNEEDSIPPLLSQLKKTSNSLDKYKFEYIMVENGSSDASFKLLLYERKKDKRIKILKMSKNYGCDGGIIAGLNYAEGDAAIVMMADLQDDPKLIPKFIERWNEGYDVVYGIVSKRQGIKITRKIGTYLFYRLMNLLSNRLLPPDVSDFRLLDRKVYKVIAEMPEHDKFFRGLSSWTGFRSIGIPFVRPKRVAGVSKADLTTVFTVAKNGLFAFSTIPLLIPWYLAVVFLIVSIIFFIINQMQYGVIFSLFTILTLLIAIQNEYLKRILAEVRNRPNYIVDKTFGLTPV